MFFHPIRDNVDNSKKLSTKEIKERFDSVGLKPVVCNVKTPSDFLNDFGHLRNDIQQFLAASDPSLKRMIVENMEVVTQSGANKNMSIEDIRNSIIPKTVQTPADISRFARVMASRYESSFNDQTQVTELVEKVDSEKPIESFEETAQ